MVPEERLNTELDYVSTDITRASMVLDTIKLTVFNSANNPFWTMVLQDLSNAKSRISNIRAAVGTTSEPVLPAELPAAAPPPAPLV
jgi:hypothetical protein